MKADVLALIDTYATGMQIAMWAGSAVFAAAHLGLAWLAIAIGRRVWVSIRRSYRSFVAANQLCRDVENHLANVTRKETP